MLKKILIALVALILICVVALFAAVMLTPTRYHVEREVTINRPRNEVFEYVRFLGHQNEWGPWFKKDPGMKQATRGTDGTVGFVQTWDSSNENIGAGEQEIKKINDGQRVDTEIRFLRPFESKTNAYITTDAVGTDQTTVKWGFDGEMPRPMNLFLLVMDTDKMVGKDFEDGLGQLKAILEKH